GGACQSWDPPLPAVLALGTSHYSVSGCSAQMPPLCWSSPGRPAPRVCWLLQGEREGRPTGLAHPPWPTLGQHPPFPRTTTISGTATFTLFAIV
ncbi:MAG TPA: hypothetical protein VHI52_09420, partial [Verrucomicrobiae bacterium]|nr:hypothetical protein [Verrucomicrobiae bacterium]